MNVLESLWLGSHGIRGSIVKKPLYFGGLVGNPTAEKPLTERKKRRVKKRQKRKEASLNN